jgi:hypothetical protein
MPGVLSAGTEDRGGDGRHELAHTAADGERRMRDMLVVKRAVMVIVALAIAGATFQTLRAQGQEISESMITHSRGQDVLPFYQGWHPNPDGTIDLLFGYLNQNWREEPDIPVGPDNNVSAPYGPDAGQPTHFLPRNNRFIFAVRVPKTFTDKDEVIWTLNSKGKMHKVYATLHPAYIKDDAGLSREYFGSNPPNGNNPPEIVIEGAQSRTVKVGEASLLTVKVTDDGVPGRGFGDDGAAAAQPTNNNRNRNATPRPSICGENRQLFFCGEPNEGAGNLSSVKGLRMACFLYRGDPEARTRGDFGHAANVVFDPPQEKVWEDHRGGSPWAAGYTLPPLPKDNIWNIQTSFKAPGLYTVRCQAHDGLRLSNTNVTFNVTP